MPKNWLEAMQPEMDAKIREILAQQRFSPVVAFDFDHVQTAVEIVQAAMVTKVLQFSEVEIDEEGLLSEPGSINLLHDACEKAAQTAKSFFERLTNIAERDLRAKA